LVLERACFFAYLLFLVLFPLAMGGREIWAQPVALGWCGGVLAGLLLAGALRGRQIFRWHWSYLFFLVPLAYAGLQLWPSATVTRWLAPETFQAWNALHGLGLDAVAARLSLAPVETWRQVLFFLLLGLCYFLGLNLCRQRRDIFTLAAAVVASAVLDALVGFYPEFAGARPWYWYIDGATAPGTVSGTFLNHNHFACLMTMGVLMAFGLLFAILARKGYRQPRPETSAPGSPGNDRKVAESWVESAETPAYALPGALALLFVLFILVVAQALSYSRGGGISMLVLGLVFFLWWLYRGSRFQQKRHIVACLAVLVGAGYIALFEAANRLAERYALLAGGIEQLTTEGRLLIWQDALPMLKTWWLTGIGSGAFANVSPRYESGWALDMLFLHAHNDWLEALVEFGLPMAGSLMIALLVWLAIQGRRLQRQADSRLRWLGLGALFAIVAVLLHELVDFNLQAPAVATVFVALLVVLVRCGQEGTRHKAQEDGVTGLRGYGATGNSLEAPKGRGTLGTPSPSSASGAEQGTGLRTQDPGPSGQAKSGSPISNPQSPISNPRSPIPVPPASFSIFHFPFSIEIAFRLAFALAALASLWWLAGYCRQEWRSGHQAALFRNLTSDVALRDRELGEREYRNFIRLADAAMKSRPKDLEILRNRAVWRQRLALRLAEQWQGNPATIGEIRTLLVSARDDMRLVCSHYPTNGYCQLFYAQLTEQCADGVNDQPNEARVEAFHDLAHRNYPTLAGVTRACANYYWSAYCRLREKEEGTRHKALGTSGIREEESRIQNPESRITPISNPQSPIPAPQAPEGGIQNPLTPTLTPTLAPPAPPASDLQPTAYSLQPKSPTLTPTPTLAPPAPQASDLQPTAYSLQPKSPTLTLTPTLAPQAPSAPQALRDKALATWREAVAQNPAAIAEALPLIWQADPSVARLRESTPEQLVAQEALFLFLMDKQCFAEALATLKTMERLNRTRPTVDDIKHLPIAEIYRLDRRSRAEVAKMIEEQTLVVLGLMEDWPARARHLAAYQQAMDEVLQQKLDQLLATASGKDLHRRETVLQAMLEENPGALAPRIHLAEIRYILGKPEEATAVLMPLVYRDDLVARPVLDSALAMLKKWAPAPARDEFSRLAFLKLALRIQLAEADPRASSKEWPALLMEVGELETLASRNPYHVWIQYHLIPYYAGRLHELAGHPELAAAAYKRCLAISPNNLFAQNRLAGGQLRVANYELRIKEQGTGPRTQDPGPSGQAKSGSPISNPQSPIPAPQAPEGGIQNLLTPTLTPTPAPQALSRYGEALALYSVSASETRIKRTGTLLVTQSWLCTGDVTRDYAVLATYRQGNQVLFYDKFSVVADDSPMVTWRVGELIPLSRKIVPMTMAIHSGIRLENGRIDIELSLVPLSSGHPPPRANPPVRIPLFVVGTANERE
jgi:O-antigen ligase/tetratricopeptide (TPR) repeat protein